MPTKEIIAHNYLQKTIELKEEIEVSFLALGERLSRIRAEELWKSGYESFEEFLHDAKISEATASKLINIYVRFHIGWKLSPKRLIEAGGWSVVATLLPVCKTKAEAEEWLGKAKELSRLDLEREIKELRTGKSMASCKHANSYVIRVCRECGDRIREYEEN